MNEGAVSMREFRTAIERLLLEIKDGYQNPSAHRKVLNASVSIAREWKISDESFHDVATKLKTDRSISELLIILAALVRVQEDELRRFVGDSATYRRLRNNPEYKELFETIEVKELIKLKPKSAISGKRRHELRRQIRRHGQPGIIELQFTGQVLALNLRDMVAGRPLR